MCAVLGILYAPNGSAQNRKQSPEFAKSIKQGRRVLAGEVMVPSVVGSVVLANMSYFVPALGMAAVSCGHGPWSRLKYRGRGVSPMVLPMISRAPSYWV